MNDSAVTDQMDHGDSLLGFLHHSEQSALIYHVFFEKCYSVN